MQEDFFLSKTCASPTPHFMHISIGNYQYIIRWDDINIDTYDIIFLPNAKFFDDTTNGHRFLKETLLLPDID